MTNDSSEAFKESVKFIDYRALDPEHELSEAKDTFKDKLENDNNNHNDKASFLHAKWQYGQFSWTPGRFSSG